jgi:O-antigen/teichoic acid export membrane protein
LRDFALGPLIGTGISMVTVPVITRIVAPEEFGKSSIFTLVQTFFSVIVLLGQDQAFVRYFNSEKHSKNEILYNSIIVPLFFSLILIIAVIIFKKPFSYWLFDQYEPVIMFVLCFFLIALLLHRFALLFIRMELRGKLYSILNISSQIINFVFLLIFLLFFERSFRAIVYASMFTIILNALIALFFLRKTWSLQWKYFNKNLIKDLMRFGIPLVPATALSWLLNSFALLSGLIISSPPEGAVAKQF